MQVLLTDVDDNPYPVRTTHDESQLIALVTSIKEVGLLQVPVARKVGNRFQLAFGHRRRKAFEQLYQTDWAGLASHEMPLIVLDLTDQEMFEISITENLKREDLNPIEKATALRRYMDEFGATSAQAARLFGIPEGTIRGTVRLLKLPEEEQAKMKAGELSQRAARKILEKPETEQKRLELKEGFDLRRQLIILLYERYYSEVSDELIYKKIRSLVEENKQLQHQIEMMNGRRLEEAAGNTVKNRRIVRRTYAEASQG